MDASYQPASGIARWQTGTPSIPGVIAVDEGVKLIAEAGLDRVREKSLALTAYLIELSDAWLTPLGFAVVSPREDARRGGHVALAHDDAMQINQALAKAGVIADVRPPNLLRVAPVALTTPFVEVWEGMTRIRDVVASGT
jgi:kynureninase